MKMLDALEYYFRRFGFCERLIAGSPAEDLRLAVVVPCFDEPELLLTLESLWNCERPASAAEVIVVINSAADADEPIRERNEETYVAAAAWADAHRDKRLVFHMLHVPDLPPKQAGVGLARKIGMDEALRRVAAEGVIVGLDADCQCDANYLCAIEEHFARNANTPGASIYFEHPQSGPLPAEIYCAAALYELHLRYYVQALRHAGFPYAFHTIGSSMAVRARTYMEQGGMNKRKAGEDFYFLQKIIALGGFSEINRTRVIPSPRGSDRVPFGTGRAVREQLSGQPKQTYPLEAFLDLKAFWSNWSADRHVRVNSACMREFLKAQNIDQVLGEIRANTADADAFRRRFVRWFDGFMAMKFVHFARDKYYGARPVQDEAGRLLELLGWAGGSDVLEDFRHLDRYGRLPNAARPVKKNVT